MGLFGIRTRPTILKILPPNAPCCSLLGNEHTRIENGRSRPLFRVERAVATLDSRQSSLESLCRCVWRAYGCVWRLYFQDYRSSSNPKYPPHSLVLLDDFRILVIGLGHKACSHKKSMGGRRHVTTGAGFMHCLSRIASL